MLRPSKIFVSLHQLRHYIHNRLSELAVTHQPNSLVHFKHTSATQQMMSLFTTLQKSALITRAPVQTIATHEKLLLQKINQHFPVTKAFSSPALHGRVWANAHIQPSCLGFRRPATALGLGYSFGAARQYSTSPMIFQQHVAARTNSVFSQISSRSFTPISAKLNHTDINESLPKKISPVYQVTINDTKSYGAKSFAPEPALTPMSVSVDSNSCIIRHDEVSNLHKEKKVDTPSLKTSKSLSACSIYLLIPMNATQFWNSTKKNKWSTEKLSTSFVDSIEQMAYEYQIHIDGVLKLLDRLERYGKFRIVTGQDEIRVYFPPSIQSKEEALMVLETLHIVSNNCYSIQVEDCDFIDDEGTLSNNSSIGSGYFQELQLFLDHTDYLIEASPLFNQR